MTDLGAKAEIAALEARVKALELMLETLAGKAYSAHRDFADAMDDMDGVTAWPDGWEVGKDAITVSRLRAVKTASSDLIDRTRQQAALFRREWRRSRRRPLPGKPDA